MTAEPRERVSRGSALVMVLLVVSMLFALATVLLFQTTTERVVAVNEQDYMKALEFAEAGLVWSRQRILLPQGSGTFTSLLRGPDGEDSEDDHLLGLRDLTLSASDEFTSANEWLASAIVERDFGEGSRSWEVIRLPDGDGTRVLVYVRIDDNFDDDPTDPANNDPLTDTDGRIRATVVAEYPVFVGTSGVEVANRTRSRARRTLMGTFGAGDSPPAILVDGDLEMAGGLALCGDCGGAHANGNMTIKDSPAICRDATSTGSFSASGNPTIGGVSGGGHPIIEVPVINPYDTLYVPSVAVFDTTALNLPTQLRCAAPTTGDPGNAKYFAFVADDDKGLIFKAYWSFDDERWEWKLLDDLSDSTIVKLDDCGRSPQDAAYGAGVDDEKSDEFYGWKLTEDDEGWDSCPTCGSTGADKSLCDLASNDHGANGYYDAATGSLVGSIPGSSAPALPGSFAPDGELDLQPDKRLKGSLWQSTTDDIFSPLYNAVVFFYGNVKIDKELGKPGKQHCSSTGCGPIPASKWMASLIVYGDLFLDKKSYHGPANPAADYFYQFIAGRDIKSGEKQNEQTAACGSGCSSTAPADIVSLAGMTAAHEQVDLQKDARYFGTIVVEDASTCSDAVHFANGHLSKLKEMDLFYDCVHPPGSSVTEAEMQRWQEVD